MSNRDIATIEDIKNMFNEEGDDTLLDEYETHSGTWKRDGDVFRFEWSIDPEE